MSAPSIFPARLDWPSVIGNLLLNFGTLDYMVFVYLKDHLPTEEYLKVREWHLKDRFTRIADHLMEAEASEDEQSRFGDLVKRLDPIREIRNHLAHGHMFTTIDEKTYQPTVTIMKARDLDMHDSPDCDQVHFKDILAAMNELGKIIKELDPIAGFSTSANFKLPSNVELDENIGRLLSLPPDALKQLQKKLEQ